MVMIFDAKAALQVPLMPNDADASTVEEYLRSLLVLVLVMEESFSGKRPFGNSGWLYEIKGPLEDSGLLPEAANWDEVFADLVEAL